MITQEVLRHRNDLPEMIQFIQRGGIWTEPVILLKRPCENGLIYIEDGHHRCVATFLARRKMLFPQEFLLKFGINNCGLHLNLGDYASKIRGL